MDRPLTFRSLAFKTIVVHTVTYFCAGLLAVWLLDYSHQFEQPVLRDYMRPVDDPIVRLGPLVQPLRGLLFAFALYPLREAIFGPPRGWLALFGMLVFVGIFSTFGPAPGSIEGLLYTKVPVTLQLGGLIEVLTQALLLSIILHAWVRHPEKKWLSRTLVTAFVVAIGLPALGLLAAPLGR